LLVLPRYSHGRQIKEHPVSYVGLLDAYASSAVRWRKPNTTQGSQHR
jgi:hypothetical protein